MAVPSGRVREMFDGENGAGDFLVPEPLDKVSQFAFPPSLVAPPDFRGKKDKGVI